jgi:hypothetical protein
LLGEGRDGGGLGVGSGGWCDPEFSDRRDFEDLAPESGFSGRESGLGWGCGKNLTFVRSMAKKGVENWTNSQRFRFSRVDPSIFYEEPTELFPLRGSPSVT